MRHALFGLMVCTFLLGFRTADEQENPLQCRKAFVYKSEAFALNETIGLCFDTAGIPLRYKAEINMPVCDDTLCSNVVLIFYWDLAGHYTGFDTIPEKPLTKFDHQESTTEDSQIEHLDERQLALISASWRKYGLPGYSELFD